MIDWFLSIDWETAANISQVASALFVAIGGYLIIRQLRQIKIEERHKKWEALQWALSLFSRDDIYKMCKSFSEQEPHEGSLQLPPKATEIANRVIRGLELVKLAIEDGYLDTELYFTARGSALIDLTIENLIENAQHESMKHWLNEALREYWRERHPKPGTIIDMAAKWAERRLGY